MGFPIQRPPDQCLFASSPELFAGCRVFRRLWSPRHPPHALGHLTRQPQPLRAGASLLPRAIPWPSIRHASRPRLVGARKPNRALHRTVHVVKERYNRPKRHQGHRAQKGGGQRPAAREPAARGGARRPRTADPRLAKPVLSQLSYGPTVWWVWVDSNHRPHPYQGCALTA